MTTTPPVKKKIALNVYLLKKNPDVGSNGIWQTNDILSSPIASSGKVSRIKTDAYPIGPAGEFGTLHIRRPITETAPEWLKFVQPGLSTANPLPKLKNKSVSAILAVPCAGRQFVIAFGHGRFMIEPTLIENRFGIKTVLNSISENEVASIDRQTFDASPRLSRTQTIKLSSISDYVINAEQDLLRGLVGRTKPEYAPTLGTMLAGIDSFKTSVGIDVSELRPLLTLALQRSASKDYLAKDSDGNLSKFAWVDNLQAVSDVAIVKRLENALWAKFSANDLSKMWMAVPDIVDWSEVTGFAYSKAQLNDDDANLAATLDLAEFKATLKASADVDALKRQQVFQVLSNGLPPKPLQAYRCIYAEIQENQDLFVLNVGTWYKVESSFKTAVEVYFTNLPRKAMAPPFMAYSHDGEGKYNEDVCSKSVGSLAMLDRQLVKFGGTHDKIEVCDIFKEKSATTNGEFIHVKRGRSSATLSHLFAQGLVSSTLLVKETGFVAEVNKQLAKQKFNALPVSFKAPGYDVVYAIVDGQANKVLDLPFFSKVTLHGAGRSISAFGYGVKIMHIPESSAHLVAAAAKKAGKKAVAAAAKVGKKKLTAATKRSVKAGSKAIAGKNALNRPGKGVKSAASAAAAKKATPRKK